ncbi:MAG: hypothetical protein IPJ73_19800 [Zoogloea sp.]|nr:hypothetical protein [Zoogloea sp.]
MVVISCWIVLGHMIEIIGVTILRERGLIRGGRYTVRWHPWGKNGKNFVFEILNDGGVLVGYEKQCALYFKSLEKGLPEGQLFVAATALAFAVFSMVGIRKK